MSSLKFNKKAQLLGEYPSLIATTVFVVLLCILFFILIMIFVKIADTPDASGIKLKQYSMLENILNSPIKGTPIIEKIKEWQVTRDNTELKTEILKILNNLEYEYRDLKTDNLRIRGYALFIKEKEIIPNSVSGDLSIESSNFEAGNCVIAETSCMTTVIEIPSSKGKLYVGIAESEAAKERVGLGKNPREAGK